MRNNNLQEKIVKWLRLRICNLKTKEIKAWLIGSIANGKRSPNDCDLLLIAPLNEFEKIVELIVPLKNDFRSQFRIPLHLTIISNEELEDCKEFLSKVFKTTIIRI